MSVFVTHMMVTSAYSSQECNEIEWVSRRRNNCHNYFRVCLLGKKGKFLFKVKVKQFTREEYHATIRHETVLYEEKLPLE